MVDFRDNPTFGLPSPQLAAINTESGKWSDIWYRFLVRLAQLSAEQPFEPISLGASPFTYTARTIGHIFITGGTVSARSLVRSGASLAVPSDTFIPVAANDMVTVTYSVLPTMTFIPSARA